MKKLVCKKCGNEVLPEKDKALKKEYPYYCSFCDGPEFEVDDELGELEDEDDVQAAEAETRRIITKQMLGEIRDNGKLPVFRKLDQEAMDELIGKVRPELLAYIMCCGSDD